MECQQTCSGTDQIGSRQITDQSRAMIKSVSLNEAGVNVKKTNTDFRISICKMEYVMHNISVLIPCQRPSFSDTTIKILITKTTCPRSQHMWHSSFCFFIISVNHFIKCSCTLAAVPLDQIYKCLSKAIFIKDC